MLVRSTMIFALATGTALLAGCADNNSLFGNSSNLTTASVAPVAAATPKTDPACAALASQIDGLRKEGIADKIEKAAQKKYKLTTAELAKADQLNKTNADFQGKCSNYKPVMASAATTPAAPAMPAKVTAAASTAASAGDTASAAAAAKP